MDSPGPGMASVAQRTVLVSFITIVFMSSMTLNKPSMMLSCKAVGLTCVEGSAGAQGASGGHIPSRLW